MKRTKFIFYLFFVLMTMPIFQSCSSNVTVCQCLKDDGSHKEECDELGNSLTEEEMSNEMNKCN